MSANLSERPMISHAFSTRTPELALRAARAAAELDRLMLGHQGQLGGSRRVADALSGFVDLFDQLDLRNGSVGGVKSFLDPSSSRVFVNASEKSKIAEKIDSYEKLKEALLHILQMLESAQSKALERNDLTKLRDFFIYLSDFAAAESRTFVSRPKQPYRR